MQLTGRLDEIVILWLSVQLKHVYADAINLSWILDLYTEISGQNGKEL